jgi:hypothetical protein
MSSSGSHHCGSRPFRATNVAARRNHRSDLHRPSHCKRRTNHSRLTHETAFVVLVGLYAGPSYKCDGCGAEFLGQFLGRSRLLQIRSRLSLTRLGHDMPRSVPAAGLVPKRTEGLTIPDVHGQVVEISGGVGSRSGWSGPHSADRIGAVGLGDQEPSPLVLESPLTLNQPCPCPRSSNQSEHDTEATQPLVPGMVSVLSLSNDRRRGNRGGSEHALERESPQCSVLIPEHLAARIPHERTLVNDGRLTS